LTKPPIHLTISTLECEVITSQSTDLPFLFHLHIQHRMHPNIAQVVKTNFCSNLQNSVFAQTISTPKFLPFNVRFILHDFLEKNSEGRSIANTQEAKFVPNLAFLLIAHGYKPTEITIIPFFKAQMLLIQDLIQKCYTKLQKNTLF
jgi:hypothetical protein